MTDFRSVNECPICCGDLVAQGLAGCCGVLAVPLFKRDGTPSGYALVDLADISTVVWRRWCLGRNGYASTNGGALNLHRLLLGRDDGGSSETDHINRNKLDNRRSNLRLVTRAQNAQNLGPRGEYRGVSWHGPSKRYRARVYLDGVDHHLGCFTDAEEAAAVATAFRAEHMPFSEDARVKAAA